jgi:hypothetical protein
LTGLTQKQSFDTAVAYSGCVFGPMALACERLQAECPELVEGRIEASKSAIVNRT